MITKLIITKQKNFLYKKFIKKFNFINEGIRSVLNFLIFFLQKDFTSTKKHKTAYSEQKKKKKNTYKKHLGGKKLLIRLFAFCVFTWLCFFAFRAFSVFSALHSFCAFCACKILS